MNLLEALGPKFEYAAKRINWINGHYMYRESDGGFKTQDGRSFLPTLADALLDVWERVLLPIDTPTIATHGYTITEEGITRTAPVTSEQTKAMQDSGEGFIVPEPAVSFPLGVDPDVWRKAVEANTHRCVDQTNRDTLQCSCGWTGRFDKWDAHLKEVGATPVSAYSSLKQTPPQPVTADPAPNEPFPAEEKPKKFYPVGSYKWAKRQSSPVRRKSWGNPYARAIFSGGEWLCKEAQKDVWRTFTACRGEKSATDWELYPPTEIKRLRKERREARDAAIINAIIIEEDRRNDSNCQEDEEVYAERESAFFKAVRTYCDANDAYQDARRSKRDASH